MDKLEKAKRLVRACESVPNHPGSWERRVESVLEELNKVNQEESVKSTSEYKPWPQEDPGIDY